MNNNLFLLPIKSINGKIKKELEENHEFEFNSHNIIDFGNKKFMLKVARLKNNNVPMKYNDFKNLYKYTYHLNQLYMNEFDCILLCIVFADSKRYIKISKTELKRYVLTPQHNILNCYQCDIDLKKHIHNIVEL